MIRSLVAFVLGVYVGQEYGNIIPNVKNKTYELLEDFKKTEFYKDVYSDIKKSK